MESFWYVDKPLNIIISDIAQFVKNAPAEQKLMIAKLM